MKNTVLVNLRINSPLKTYVSYLVLNESRRTELLPKQGALTSFSNKLLYDVKAPC